MPGKTLLLLLTVGLLACSQYEVNLNGRNIYQPPALFSDFQIEDAGLNACIKKAVKQQNITRADDLKNLQCIAGGIESAQGLDVFNQIETLDLGHNRLKTLLGIKSLPHLKRLNLEGNPITICTEIRAIAKGIAVTAPQCQP